MDKFELTSLDVQRFKEYIKDRFDYMSDDDFKALLKGQGSVLQTMLDAKDDNEKK